VLDPSQITMPLNKLRNKKNNQRKERKGIKLYIVLLVVSHQITKRQLYYIMCHGCLSKREERFFKKKRREECFSFCQITLN
jgi:hypothetical protein